MRRTPDKNNNVCLTRVDVHFKIKFHHLLFWIYQTKRTVCTIRDMKSQHLPLPYRARCTFDGFSTLEAAEKPGGRRTWTNINVAGRASGCLNGPVLKYIRTPKGRKDAIVLLEISIWFSFNYSIDNDTLSRKCLQYSSQLTISSISTFAKK